MTDRKPNRDNEVSDADRDQIVQLLEEARGEVRLTAAELEARSAVARAAVTYRDLAAATADLPSAALAEPDTTTELMRIDRRFGTVVREGPWVVPRRIEVKLT